MIFHAIVKKHVRGLLGLILWGAWAAPAALGETPPGNEIVTNSIGMALVSLPGGTFRMGARMSAREVADLYEAEHPEWFVNEHPAQNVEVDAFAIGRHEVTVAQYAEVMGDIGEAQYTGENLPMNMVSWWEAIRFCNELSERENRKPCYDGVTGQCDYSANGYRLPTEAEWEYACRAGTDTAYYWGDKQEPGYAWDYDSGKRSPQPVGLTKPNEWGLYDMIGNVYEWCNDWYGEHHYAERAQKGALRNPRGPDSGTTRNRRGGSSRSTFDCVRCAFRNANMPMGKVPDIGLRIVTATREN